MADWLRPVFSRTPKCHAQETPTIDPSPSFTTDEKTENEEDDGHWLDSGFRASSTSTPSFETFPYVRHPETVYHAPSTDQLVDSLKVFMMNRSTMAPLPIEYNSCVLRVLEAYNDLQDQLIKKEETLEEIRQQRAADIKEMEGLRVLWDNKETDYKADVKRLEVLLSENPGGLEKVMLARSKSNVHGSRRIGCVIGPRVGTMKKRNLAMDLKSQDTAVDFQEQRPVQNDHRAKRLFQRRSHQASQDFIAPPFASKRTMSSEKGLSSLFRVLHPRSSSCGSPKRNLPTAEMHQKCEDDGNGPGLIELQLEAWKQQGFDAEFALSSRGPSNSSTSEVEPATEAVRCTDLGLGLFEENLSDASSVSTSGGDREKLTSDSPDLEMLAPSHMGFSFRPGDDSNPLEKELSRHRTSRKELHEQIRQRGYNPSDNDFNPSSAKVVLDKQNSSQPPTSQPLRRPKPSRHPYPSANTEGAEHVSQDDSSSSIVTAIRHNSRRSGEGESHQVDQIGRQRLEISKGSNEAVTAAARAFGSASKKSNKAKKEIRMSVTAKEVRDKQSVKGDKRKDSAAGGKGRRKATPQ